MRGQKVLITGATGFIGKHLAAELAKDNEVFALVRPSRTDNKSVELESCGIKIIWAGLSDNKSYAKEIADMDFVFHLAALFKIDGQKKDLYDANVLGTRMLLDACRNTKVRRFIYYSTAYVSSGRRERDNISEDEPYADDPRNWYEWSKAEAEREVLAYYKDFGLPVTIVRPATVYGPGSLYAWYFAFKTFANGIGFISNNGSNKIHLISVYDVIKASALLAEKEESNGEIYNICDEHPYTQLEAATLICKAMGVRKPLFYIPKNLCKLFLKIPFISKFYFDISPEVADYYMDNFTFSNKKLKAAGHIYMHPDFKDGLEETVRWYKEQKKLDK